MNKKFALVSIVLFTCLTLTSCLKEYDCTCYSRYYQNGQIVHTFANTKNVSEQDRTKAGSTCAESNQSTLVDGNGYVSECKITDK